MKIAVVTGTRAEFGLLSPLMHKIQASEHVDLITIVTGTHLLPDFGYTVEDIKSEGFTVDATIPEIASARDGADVARQVGSGIVAFTDALVSLAPDALVLLGDRYELLSAATAAFFLEVPIVHLHGGEVTEGAFDDTIRHAISKFASVHAVAAPEYRDRLVRAGEQPASVHVVGGFGVDLVAATNRFTRSELEAELGIAIGEQLLLVTYHPVTAAPHETQKEIDALVAALEKFPDATVVFTLPNADPEHDIIFAAISKAVSEVFPDSIDGFHFKEDFYYNRTSRQMEAQIISIAPTFKGKELFWVYYPELKYAISAEMHNKLFQREFKSTIYKETSKDATIDLMSPPEHIEKVLIEQEIGMWRTF